MSRENQLFFRKCFRKNYSYVWKLKVNKEDKRERT